MSLMNVDPVEYGRLISTVESLEKKVDAINADRTFRDAREYQE